VNVGSVRMPRFVIECAIWLRGMPLAPNGRRAMRRNVAAALIPAAAVSAAALLPALRQTRNRNDQRYRKYSN